MEEKRNDIKISGSGSLNGGEYGKVSISGSGKANGDILCTEFKCSGSAHAYGSIDSEKGIGCSGSMSCDGNMKAGETVSVSGSCKVQGNIKAQSVRISGSLKTENSLAADEISISGSIRAKGNVEGEKIRIAGGGRIDGTLNGESIEIALCSSKLHAASIGGTTITVESRAAEQNFINRLFLNCFFGASDKDMLTSELIEGDTIDLNCTECKTVRGKNVTIRENCKIGRVEYSESLTVEPGAAVTESEKM